MGDEVDFLPADRRESFLEGDSITLSARSQACPKYQKQICNIFATLKENMKNKFDFMPADKPQRFLQIDTIILDACGQAYPNYPK